MTTDTNRSARIRATLASAIALIGLAGAAHARADAVDLSIVDRDTGQVLRTWRHHGHLFVVGRPGDRYSLRVANHTEGRVLAVVSVDGVNVVTGETADYSQRGYVLTAHASYDVTGWRKSNSEVAAFTFAPLPQSYAARTGRPADVGVIGMAVFREKVYAPPPEPEVSENVVTGFSTFAPSQRAASAPAVRGAAPAPPPPPSTARADAAAANEERQDEKLGTAHGAREWSAISLVDFERATSHPQFIRQIEYDTYANLVAAGVIGPPRAQRALRFAPYHSSGGSGT
jgi:hypothetical protein